MNTYEVMGHTTVTVAVRVKANSEEEAYEKAAAQCNSLAAFCGNGGTDKLIGVYNYNESVFADGLIEYDDITLVDE